MREILKYAQQDQRLSTEAEFDDWKSVLSTKKYSWITNSKEMKKNTVGLG
jgi:hypothetical protein